MSYGIRERDPVPEFRNNITYFSMKFQPPDNDVCVGSAYGSGAWYPDFGGYKGAPEMNRWITPAEAWFETNCLKKKRELNRRAKLEAEMYAEPTRRAKSMCSDRKVDIYRKDDPFIKSRESLWIANNHTEALAHESNKRTRKFLNRSRSGSNAWQKNWGSNLPKKYIRPAPRILLNMRYQDVIAMNRKDTSIFFRNEEIAASKRSSSVPAAPGEGTVGGVASPGAAKELSDVKPGLACGRGGRISRVTGEVIDDPSLVKWDNTQPRDWNDTRVLGTKTAAELEKHLATTKGSSTRASGGFDSSARTSRTQFRTTQSEFRKQLDMDSTAHSDFRRTM